MIARKPVNSFTPLPAAIGGALIGLAAALLMLTTGRIAGVSGIAGGLIGNSSGRGWRAAFIAGLVLAPAIAGLAGFPLHAPRMPANWSLLAAAGLLVGFGSRLGAGCTSGHGVCGIARLSLRSLVATLVFMAAAMVVVAVARHALRG